MLIHSPEKKEVHPTYKCRLSSPSASWSVCSVMWTLLCGEKVILRRLDLRVDCGIVEPLGSFLLPSQTCKTVKKTHLKTHLWQAKPWRKSDATRKKHLKPISGKQTVKKIWRVISDMQTRKENQKKEISVHKEVHLKNYVKVKYHYLQSEIFSRFLLWHIY